MKLEIKNAKTTLSSEEQDANLEKVKYKTEFELFQEFYRWQHNIELDEKSTELMKNIVAECKDGK